MPTPESALRPAPAPAAPGAGRRPPGLAAACCSLVGLLLAAVLHAHLLAGCGTAGSEKLASRPNRQPAETLALSAGSPPKAAALATRPKPAGRRGKRTPTPVPTPSPTPVSGHAAALPAGQMPVRYLTQPGDTLPAVAAHFGLTPGEITSPDPLPAASLLPAGQLLLLPPLPGLEAANRIAAQRLLPDGEVVYGPSAAGFDLDAYLAGAGGALRHHQEWLGSTGWVPAAVVIQRVATETSINPRLLLGVLEWQCGCVLGPSNGQLESGYALGVQDYRRQGLYGQLSWAADRLSAGYYGWRAGTVTGFHLPDGSQLRPAAGLNAGSVALLALVAGLANESWPAHPAHGVQLAGAAPGLAPAWEISLDPQAGLPAVQARLFGDPWSREAEFGPVVFATLAQPALLLPFEPRVTWSFTSGPHKVWETDNVLAALDFAPATDQAGCLVSPAWITAVAAGRVVRAEFSQVILDLDEPGRPSDGLETTGWAVLYLHVAQFEQVLPGTVLKAGERIGHPSCEGGFATGTHVHIARKYNGEWLAAGGPLPFVLSGWSVVAGERPYEGQMVQAENRVVAHVYGSAETLIVRTETPVAGGSSAAP